MHYLLVAVGILIGLWAMLQAYVLAAGYFLPLDKVAGSYLRVRLRKLGIADALPRGCVAEIAAAYASAAEAVARSTHRGRAWTLPAMNRAMDVGVARIEAWVRRGEAIARASADSLPDGGEPLVLAPAFLSEALPRHGVPRGAAR